jgi:AcrR family transcriptional regulator
LLQEDDAMNSQAINSGTLRPGGRTARNRAAVFAATLSEIVASGYTQASIEAIAERAGVHKTTIYRRWRTKDQLIAEALADAAATRSAVDDTGDIDADIRSLARTVVATLTSREGIATVRAIVAESPGSPELREVMRQFWSSRLALVGPMIDGAIDRMQLPVATSPAELMKYVAAPLYYQLLMTDEPLSEAAADRAAAAALAAARAGVLSIPLAS